MKPSENGKPGLIGAVGRFIQRRPWSTAAGLAVLAIAGAVNLVFVGFEIGDRKLPTYDLWKRYDKIVEAASCRSLPDPLQAATYQTGLIRLHSEVRNVTLDVDRPSDDFNLMSFTGGGMASFGDDLLLLPYDGRIYAERPGEPVRATRILAPETRREAFQALAKDPNYADYTFEPYYIRYNDLAFYDDGARRGLLASYTEFDPDEACFVNAVARLDIPASIRSIEEVKAGPADWTVIYRSKPCLPLKKRLSALEGHMGGGRMALVNPTTVVLTMGDFHLDGMRSEGLGIAQDPAAEYGKVMQIDIQTGASRILTTGHRNPQGIAVDDKGDIYVAEHGPHGGDELNKIVEGRNYGWPKESLGITYSNKKLPESDSFGRHDTFEAPIFAWMPSPAISSATYVRPGFHDAWTGDLLAGSLAQQSIIRVRFAAGKPVYSEIIPLGTRIRAIHQHTNGQIVLWSDNHELIWLNAEDLGGNEDALADYVRREKIGSALAGKLETAVARCAECHSFEVGDSSRTPSLARIYGDPIASTSFSNYSAALAGKSGRWTRENLAKFLTDPQSFAPGSAMPAVITDPKVAAAVVDYLRDYDGRF